MISRHFRNKKRKIRKLTSGYLDAHWEPFPAFARSLIRLNNNLFFDGGSGICSLVKEESLTRSS
jgi:hypothetical protein